jgi:hypothetical protein
MSYVLIILGLALVLALWAVIMIFWSKSSKKRLKQETFNRYWQHVMDLLNQKDLLSKKQAVLDADKLLDLVLKSLVVGKDLGARLKNSQKLFNSRECYQMAWEAHKLRNKIAHEINFEPTSSSCSQAVNNFKKAFRNLGYIVK